MAYGLFAVAFYRADGQTRFGALADMNVATVALHLAERCGIRNRDEWKSWLIELPEGPKETVGCSDDTYVVVSQ